MKKSRIAKLALMGASITALAATLTTSTYAWYVSNKTANVEAVAGSTASSGAGSSISLSVTGDVNDFHKTISLVDKTTGLKPVVRTGATISTAGVVTAVYKELDEAHDADGSTDGYQVAPDDTTSATQGTHYYEYVFYIKADTGCTVKPVITVTNTTTTLPTQINYSGGYKKVAAAQTTPAWAANTYYSYSNGSYSLTASEPTGWSENYTNYYTAEANSITGPGAGEDFYVNALNAAHMSLGLQKGTLFDENVTSFVGTTTVTEYSQPVVNDGNLMKVTALTNAQKPTGATEATAGARNYYEAITGYKLTDAAKTTYDASNAFANITLVANTPYKLVYHLWLDGADDQCFNACAGQTFSVAFDYTVTA